MAIEIERSNDGRVQMILTDEDADYYRFLKALAAAFPYVGGQHPLRDGLRIIEYFTTGEGKGAELAAIAFGPDDEVLSIRKYPERNETRQ